MSCKGLVKFLIFFVNFLFSLAGIVIFVFGILGVIYVNKINEALGNLHSGTIPSFFPSLVMVIGAVVFFISFCACFGAIKEINCLLVLYSIVMLLLLAVKVAITVYLLMNKEPTVQKLNEIVNHFPTSNITNVPIEFHSFEVLAKCCGTTGPESYGSAAAVPITCCPISFGKQEDCTLDKIDIYRQGCKGVVESGIGKYINIASYSLIGIAIFELISMISAMYLICYRKSDGYYEYD